MKKNHNEEVAQEEISKTHSTNLVEEKEIKEEIDNNITIENNTNTNEEVKTMHKYNKDERAKKVVEKMGIEYKEGMTLDDLVNAGRELVVEEEQEPFEFINQVSILPSTQQAIDKSLDLLWDMEDLINKVDKELQEEEEKILDVVDELKDINYFMIDLDNKEDKEQPIRI